MLEVKNRVRQQIRKFDQLDIHDTKSQPRDQNELSFQLNMGKIEKLNGNHLKKKIKSINDKGT